MNGLPGPSARDTPISTGTAPGLLLPGCDAVCAEGLLRRLHDVPLDGLTFSAGVSQWDGVSASEALISEADAALYAAKRAKRNRTCTAPAQAGAA